MKTIITVIAGLLIAGVANAQTAEGIKEGTNTVRLLLGADRSGFNGGLDYERRTGTFGVGGYLLSSTKVEDAAKGETLTFGLTATSHLVDRNNLDIFVAPGVAVTNSDAATKDGDDDTVVGPSLSIGAVYALNEKVGVGAQYLSVYNWFSDKSPTKYEFANLVVSYNF